MFYPFNWFEKPQLFAAIRADVLNWLNSNELLVFLVSDSPETPDTFEKRRLTPAEVEQLKYWIDISWRNRAFGGYTAGSGLININGLCLFGFDEEIPHASLLGLVTTPELAGIPPLHSPVLHLALAALLEEVPELTGISLPSLELKEPLPGPSSSELDQSLDLGQFDQAAQQTRHLSDRLQPISSDQRWLELSLQVEPGLTGYITSLFERYGFQGGTLTGRATSTGNKGQLVPDETSPTTIRTHLKANEDATVTIAKIQAELARLRHLGALKELEITERSFEEWAALWLDERIHRVGEHILIMLLDENGNAPAYSSSPGDILIKLQPVKEVFGPRSSGLHPSTTLTLQLMEEYLDPAKYQTMLDLGTGSGVLSIVALKRGLDKILALDANRLAVDSARKNVAFNEVDDKIIVEAGSLAVVPERPGETYSFPKELQTPPPVLADLVPFDAITANTLPHVLIDLASELAQALRPGGLLISSGIPIKNGVEVAAALKAAGFSQLEQRKQGEWVAFAHLKPFSGSI